MTQNEQYINSPVLQTQEKILSSVIEPHESIVIFDIGSCEGENSIRYARLFPNAVVYAFEPLPSNFELVNKNIQAYGAKNIFPFQLCLSDEEGTRDFYVSSGKPQDAQDGDWDYGNKSSSLLAPTAEMLPWLKFEKSITVQTATLKNFCVTKQVASIDFIHMDVQGAELMVLKGAQDFIQKINMVWLEVEAVELYKNQPLKKDIEQFMSLNGFIKLEDTVYTIAGDQFWARKDYIVLTKGMSFIYRRILFSSLKGIYKKIRRRIFN